MTARVPSLAQRLTLMTVGFVAAVWVVTALATWLLTQHELNELLDAHLAQTAALLASGEVDDGGEGVLQAPTLLREYQSRVAFQIWHKGRLVARSADAPDTPLADVGARGLSDRLIGATAWRVFTAARQDDGKAEDIIHVGEHLSARRHVLLASLRSTLVLLLALPLLAAGIVWSVRRAVQPLRTLGQTVAQRQPRALDPLPEAGVLPEVRPLVHALNDLFQRVAEQLASERRFTADAAHELRTPIAAIRMQAQVAQGAASDAERAAALTATVAGCDRTTRVVEQLLQLARLEAEAGATNDNPAPSCADLSAVAADCVRELRPQAVARGQYIDWQAPNQPVPAGINPTLAGVLLRNLLDNALRYSPDGAQVRVQLTPAGNGSGPGLMVEDSGPGLPPEELARLGERFFRVLGTGQSGSGLGWSIMRRVARLHGLRIDTDRGPTLGGLRVRIAWPAEPMSDGATLSHPV
jgi:two-component system sensor histidine kinase QseC